MPLNNKVNKMRFKLIMVSFLLGVSFFAQGQKKVTSEAFNTMLQSLLQHSVPEVLPMDCVTSTEVVYLDAREKKEYEVSHLPNARWVGYNTFKLKKVQDIDKNTPIVVYCTVGFRSEKIAEKLLNAGYSNVANLYGGIFEWMHAGKTVMNDSITQNVHTYDKEWSQWFDENSGNKIY